MKIWMFLASASVAACGVSSANATLITYNFGGTITATTIAGTTNGSSFSGSFTYDDSVAAFSNVLASTYKSSSYAAMTDMSFSSDTFVFGGAVNPANFTRSFAVTDAFDSRSDDSYQMTYNVNNGRAGKISLGGPSTIFSGLGLPQSLDLNSFTNTHSFSLNSFGGQPGQPGTLTGNITSLSLASSVASVPEPATWAMMIGGFGMIGAAMRRQRKASVSLG